PRVARLNREVSVAWRPYLAAVLVQDHGHDLSSRIALEVEPGVDDLVEELVSRTGVDREGRLPGDLCFEVIVLEGDLQHAESGPVLADVVAERGDVERNFPQLGGKLGRRQLRRGMVAVLVQHESLDRALGIAREADADPPGLGEELVGRRRKDGERLLPGGAGK